MSIELNPSRRAVLGGLAALGALGASSRADAQPFPSRQPWWVVPYPPGGGTDLVSRLIAAEISKSWGEQIIIDNKPGASTQIGMRQIAAAPHDGYMIGLMTADIAVTTALGERTQVNLEESFDYIIQLLDVPMVLVANGKMPFRTLPEFVAYAKANPGKLTAGSIGPTSIHHVGLEWFKRLAGIDMLVVPYRGVAPSLQAVVAGEVQVIFMGVGVGDDYIANGTIVPLAVGGKQRTPGAASVPTFIEQGYSTFDFSSWYGMVAPAKLPTDVKVRWESEIRKVVENPSIRERIVKTGAEINTRSSAEFAQFVRAETKKYTDVAKLIGVTP
jgi:tripartite-type tricarboxylate transporter receptor subunit TctC